MPDPEPFKLDFSNTEKAFKHLSDKELKKTSFLFKTMNKSWLVNIGSRLSLIAIKLRLPLVKNIIRNTIFDHFCGGETLLESQNAIDHLYQNNALTILDFGAESKSSEEDLDHVMHETIRAIEFAASNSSVPVVSSKVTGLADNDLLIKLNEKKTLDSGEQHDYQRLVERMDAICEKANALKVGVFFDAEESWMQEPIDELVMQMMAKYNKQAGIVYNTLQMYRHDRLEYLYECHKLAKRDGFILGVKLVRGAYMDKERARAKEMNYPSPIQKDKAATDKDFDLAIEYCVGNYTEISSCCASHNLKSNLLQARLIDEQNILKTHPHLNFCQLYGMSDNITFNLAQSGYNVAKYVVYGPVREVIPYLVRRAQENSSVTGEVSRELALIKKEIKRRGL